MTPRLEPRDRRLHARGRRALPPGARPHPGDRRPALLPPPLRRRAHARELRRRPPARPGRPGRAHRGASRESSQRRCSRLLVSLWLRGPGGEPNGSRGPPRQGDHSGHPGVNLSLRPAALRRAALDGARLIAFRSPCPSSRSAPWSRATTPGQRDRLALSVRRHRPRGLLWPLAGAYAVHRWTAVLSGSRALPGDTAAAIGRASQSGIPGFGLMNVFAVLLFPNGRRFLAPRAADQLARGRRRHGRIRDGALHSGAIRQ